MMQAPTALIADDEPLLRAGLRRQLVAAWPELEILAEARNGREAVEQFEGLGPDICFLDIHMPGISGMEAARLIGARAHLVFVTAFDQYAVQAFAQGVLDYLVKPVEASRLAETVARLRARLAAAQPALNTEALLQQLATRLQPGGGTEKLRWIKAQSGQTLRLICVDDIDFLRSDNKYTLIAWRGDGGQQAEALVRTPLKELIGMLDGTQFAQIHRAIAVNLRAVAHLVRGDNETAELHLKGRTEVLPVSRGYMGQFRQM
jgi:DNA-binding LytR/AlgR family response regulator